MGKEVKTGLGYNVKWVDAYGDESKPAFCVKDILKSLKGDVVSVPNYAFRSAVLFSKFPQPFLPFLDYLVQLRSTDEHKDNSSVDDLTATSGKVPNLLHQGLLSFLSKRCPGIKVSNMMQ